jgi:hypothetical protein
MASKKRKTAEATGKEEAEPSKQAKVPEADAAPTTNAPARVNPKRVRTLKDAEPGSGPVIYWCERSGT